MSIPESTRAQIQAYAAATGIIVALLAGIASYVRTMTAVEQIERDMGETRAMIKAHIVSEGHSTTAQRLTVVEHKQAARDASDADIKVDMKDLKATVERQTRTLDALCIATKARCPKSP